MDGGKSLLQTVVDEINNGILVVDLECQLVLWNKFMRLHSGLSAGEVCGRSLFEVFPELPEKWMRLKIRSVKELQTLAFTSWVQRPHVFAFSGTRPITRNDQAMFQDTTFFPIFKDGVVTHVGLLLIDATERAMQQQALERLNQTLQQEKQAQQDLITRLEEAQAQLLQSEKMAAIGQLAAGVAHEINNPIGFVYSNLGSLQQSVTDLIGMIEACRKAATEHGDPALLAAIDKARDDYDYDFLREDVGALLRESTEGVERVKRIVQDLREFSHVDRAEWQEADLHKGLDSTLNVVWNEIKYKATVEKHYGDIPPVTCIASQINQVFMNLIVNACHAIDKQGTITLRTGLREEGVFVSVSDTGSGIKPEHLKRLFEPFFTTKPVGKGTGLGLSLAYNIVRKHEGRIEVQSEVGKGTTFTVWLPRVPQGVHAN